MGQELARAKLADREAEIAVTAAQAEVESVRERIRQAHEDGQDPGKLGQTLRLAKEAAEQAELASQGTSRRVQRANDERHRYLAANGQKLLQELEPEAAAVVAALNEHAEALVQADVAWSSLQRRVSGYLAATGQRPVGNAPDAHALAPTIRELKHALRETVVSPLPHYQQRTALRQDEQQKRKLRDQRRTSAVSTTSRR
jgi:hypothetical protein